MLKLVKSITHLLNFIRIKRNKKRIVFYAEDKNSYLFFSGIINFLINEYNEDIYYVTSSFHDPILNNENKKINSFYIGRGSIRTIFFQLFNAPIMVMTMPELNVSYIKKSKFYCHYIYIPHNILSIHMVFRKQAFNHYDSFFCVGPHHLKELEENEKIYNIEKINKIKFGYHKIELLLGQKKNKIKNHKTIIIAPSWGKNSILEKIGNKLLSILVEIEFKIIIRPHPDTLKFYKKGYLKLKTKYQKYENLLFEENTSNMNSYLQADLMISDWSGSAFEFAFGLEKPVIFINLQKKINNTEFHLYKSQPIEVSLRDKIGEIIDIEKLNELPALINKVYENNKNYKEKIIKLRKSILYNDSSSSKIGAEYIIELLKV